MAMLGTIRGKQPPGFYGDDGTTTWMTGVAEATVRMKDEKQTAGSQQTSPDSPAHLGFSRRR